MNRIEKKFGALKRKNKKALIVFITAGYPSLNITKKLILEFDKIGVDIVEIGVPFSDPLADGPVIQESSQVALQNKVTLGKILGLVKELRRFTDIPLALMTYYNPIFCFGERIFIRQARAAGVDGLIIPDLPPEEGRTLMRLAHKNQVDVIFFISPTTSRLRMKHIAGISRGFIYYVSLTGVTGPRAKLPLDLQKQIRAVKQITVKPVCVGFGVSSASQVKKIYQIADGVIVGSAIIKKIKQNLKRKDLIERVSRYIRGLKQ
jgi:tryptophan synthase alpha chain